MPCATAILSELGERGLSALDSKQPVSSSSSSPCKQQKGNEYTFLWKQNEAETHRDDIRFEVTDVALADGVVGETTTGYALQARR